jgi:hypothetical protein
MATFKLDSAGCIARMAGENLSEKLYFIVKFNTTEEIVLCGDGEAPLGVVHESAAENYPVSVQIDGLAKVIVGSGGVTAGGRVASNATGEAVNAASGDYTLGIATEAGVAGQIIAVQLVSHGRGA